MSDKHRKTRKPNINRAKRPRDVNLQTAVTTETIKEMRMQAAAHDMALSSYVYEILKLATNNFQTLNLIDIENTIKKGNEND